MPYEPDLPERTIGIMKEGCSPTLLLKDNIVPSLNGVAKSRMGQALQSQKVNYKSTLDRINLQGKNVHQA